MWIKLNEAYFIHHLSILTATPEEGGVVTACLLRMRKLRIRGVTGSFKLQWDLKSGFLLYHSQLGAREENRAVCLPPQEALWHYDYRRSQNLCVRLPFPNLFCILLICKMDTMLLTLRISSKAHKYLALRWVRGQNPDHGCCGCW